MTRVSLWLLIVLFLAAGCSTVQVKNEVSPGTDFSRLKTFSWLAQTENPSDDIRINNEFVINTVQAAVEKNLQKKGFTRVEDGQGDFVISWFGAIEQKLNAESITHFYRPYGYGALYRDPKWNSDPTKMNVSEYEQGTLIFDFLDPKTQTLIWRGSGSDRLKENQSESQVKYNINAAVSQILADFPPQ